MTTKKFLKNNIPPGIILIFLAYIYLKTIAPDITWANNGSDGGDLITATATGGIAHPSGYPFYILLASFFQKLPLGTLAFRTNLLSTICALIAVLLVYGIVHKFLQKEFNPHISKFAGLISGLFLGTSPLFWSQAVITEVYTLHAAFVALIIFLSIQNAQNRNHQIWIDRWRGVVYGLAAGNHLTILLLIPIAIIISSSKPHSHDSMPSIKNRISSIGRQLIWMVVGSFIYLILPLRAMDQPIINWGDPINLENFWWLVSAKIYREYYAQDIFRQFVPRIQSSAFLLIKQFGLIGIVTGFIGVIGFYRSSKLYSLTMWNALVFWIVSISYQSSDAFVHFIPVLISFSIWIGLCTGYWLKNLNRHTYWRNWLLICILILNIGIGVFLNWQDVDASQDYRAKDFAQVIFNTVPKNAIVFADGDQAIFALWYFHFALKNRSDLVILSSNLLHYDWYHTSMKNAYPSIDLPGSFPWPLAVIAANPSRDICYAHYDINAIIYCENP